MTNLACIPYSIHKRIQIVLNNGARVSSIVFVLTVLAGGGLPAGLQVLGLRLRRDELDLLPAVTCFYERFTMPAIQELDAISWSP